MIGTLPIQIPDSPVENDEKCPESTKKRRRIENVENLDNVTDTEIG